MSTYQTILEQVKLSQSQSEQTIRQELAYLYHIMDFYGWGDLIVTHLSARLNDGFLISPYGLMFCEVTEKNLIHLDINGEKKQQTPYRANYNGVVSHRSIYAARPDVSCIIHTHTKNIVAVASLDKNLICLDQMSMILYGKIGYHEYGSFFTSQKSDKKFIEDLSDNKVVILKNHGVIVVGKTISEAFWNYYYLDLACEVLLKCLSATSSCHLSLVNEAIQLQVAQQFDKWNLPEDDGFPGHADLAFNAAKRKLHLSKYYD